MTTATKESKSAATIRRRRNKHQNIQPQNDSQTKRVKVNDLYIEDAEISSKDPVTGPPVLQLLMSSDWLMFLGLVAFRAVNALVIQTSFVPDEYWQSLEVAHNMAYGYGYMTWEWKTGLRGYLYPMIFASLYKVLGILHLDNRILLTKLPRLTQALLAAAGDLYLYKFARRLSGVRVARWALLCSLTSWFTFYCCVRTLTNSTETSLTTIALYYYPWPDAPRLAHWKYILLVGVAVIVRPTAAILWLPLCLWHVYRYRHRLLAVLTLFLLYGALLLSVTTLIDRYFYGYWVFVPYNFLKFNVLSGQGTFYGSHPWHWYVTQGFPVVMGSHLLPFLLYLRNPVRRHQLYVIAWTIFVYSLLGHKEFRFIYPVLPIAFFLCGEYLYSVVDSPSALTSTADSHKNNPQTVAGQQSTKGTSASDSANGATGSKGNKNESDWTKSWYRRPAIGWRFSGKIVILCMVCANLPVILYTSLIHQRGTVDVMKFIHDERKYETSYNSMSVLYLTPCHSTPYYSYVHKNVTMRFLTCEPNLNNAANYTDEAAIFYQHPVTWLKENIETMTTPPSHLVLFNTLQPIIGEFAQRHGYRDCAKFFHTHVPEGRVGSHVMVMCRVTWLEGKERVKRHRTWLHMSL